MAIQFDVDESGGDGKLTIITTGLFEIEVLTIPKGGVFPEHHFSSHHIYIIPLSKGVYVKIDGTRNGLSRGDYSGIRPDCHFVLGHDARMKSEAPIQVLMLREEFPQEESASE